MPRGIGERAAGAFPSSDSVESANRYLEALRKVWADVARSIARSVTLSLVVAGLFLLLVSNPKGTFSLGELKLTNSWLVLVTLPTVFAYLFMEIVFLSIRYDDLADLHTSVVRQVDPDLAEYELQEFLRPSTFGLNPGSDARLPANQNSYTDLMDLSAGILVLVLLVGELALEGYAYSLLFSRYGFTNAVLWVSALVSFLLIVIGVIALLQWGSSLTPLHPLRDTGETRIKTGDAVDDGTGPSRHTERHSS
jgi:hypothetical protein